MNAATAPPAAPAALEAFELIVRFGGITALSGVSLRVPHGTLVGLVGPNGAGKSTAFAVLSGLLRPNTGRVELDGLDVTARARKPEHAADWLEPFSSRKPSRDSPYATT